MFSVTQLIFFAVVEVLLLVVTFQTLKSGVASKGLVFKFYKNKQPFSYWTTVVITGVCFIVLGSLLVSDMIFGDSLREAKQICDEEIDEGMSYTEVETQFQHLFADVPFSTGTEGLTQVYLKNDYKLAEGSCRIEFQNGVVTSHMMLYLGL